MTETTNKQPFLMQEVPMAQYLFVRRWVKRAEVPSFFNESLQHMTDAMVEAGSPPQYPPSMFIHGWNDISQELELSVALQTLKPLIRIGLGTVEFPAGQALVAEFIGPIDQTGQIHQIMSKYVDKNNLTVEIAIEEYHTSQVYDPSQLKTMIIYRLYDGKTETRIIN